MTAALQENFEFVCIHLTTEFLDEECRAWLESNGVEQIREGKAFEVYGVVHDRRKLGMLEKDPDIVFVERKAPPMRVAT